MARERIGAQRLAAVRWAVRLAGSCQAATAVEYALVLGLVIAVVATGALLVGRQLDRTMARVASGHADAGGFDPTPDAPSYPAPAVAASGTFEDIAPSVSLADRYCGHALAVTFGGLVLALVAAYLAYHRRKRPAEVPNEEPPDGGSQGPSLRMRLYAKRQRLWRALLTDSELLLNNRIEVRHLMTRELMIVAPRVGLAELNELATQNRVRHLLVCDGEGCLLGVISDRDLRGASGGTARQLMTPDPTSVSPNTTLSAAITCLIEEGVSCLPVVKGGKLCGVLTTTDLVLTLQCALQLWLRVAQAVQESPEWIQQLEGISATIDRHLAEQHARLMEFHEQFSRLGARFGGRVREELAGEAGRMLRIGARLIEQVGDARQQIRRNMEELVGLMEARDDRLVGLGTLRELTGVVEMMLAIRDRYGHPLSVAMLALDRPGSACGDPAESESGSPSRAMAEVAAEVARASDFLARYRNGELAVVLPHTATDGARVFCRRVQERARDDGRLGPATVIRAGVSTALQGDDAAALLARAEAALARARPDEGDGIRDDLRDDLEPAGCTTG